MYRIQLDYGLSSFKRSGAVLGFTLLEILLAVAVLVMLVVLAVQMVNTAGLIARSGVAKMNGESRARAVFDRMSLDFRAILKRPDIDYVFQKESGSDRMSFYSQASGFYPAGVTGLMPKSPVSLVGYRIDNNRLERLGKALIWNGVTDSTPTISLLSGDTSAMVFLPLKISAQWDLSGSGTGKDPDFQVIGSQVFRFEFCFLMKDGVFAPVFDPDRSIAVIVTIAMVDNQNVFPVLDLTELAASLPDGDDPGVADRWTSVIQTLTATRSGTLPNIRVYQRFFQLGAQP